MVKTRIIALLAAVAGVAAGVATQAQQTDRARALDEQIDRIFRTREYEVPRFGPARWLPDGTAYSTVERSADRADGRDIVRYDAGSGARTILVSGSRLVPPDRTAALDIGDYAWSRDGRRLLVFTNTKKVWRQNTRGDYWVLDLASGTLRRLGRGAPESSLMFAKFSPDGSRAAYVRANNLYVERIDDGHVTPLTTDGSETTINGTSDWVYEEELGVRDGFRWSPDGTQIAFISNQSGKYKLWIIKREGTGLTPLTTGEGEERYPSWSPDGAKIAFASTRSGNWDIWVMDAPTSPTAAPVAPLQLTAHPLADLAPSWSRDGRKIAFVSYRDLEYSIYTMNADGSEQRKLTTGGNGDWGPAWSADGTAIVFASTRTGGGDVYLIKSDATPKGPYERLTTAPQRDMIPAWSPDGSKIAFVSQRTGTRDIWVMNSDGTNQIQVTRKLSGRWEPLYDINRNFIEGIGYFYLAWSPDGTSLAYTSVNETGRGEIAILRLQ